MPDRLQIIQCWRFVAAFAVIISHSYSRMIRLEPGPRTSIFDFYALGVWGHWGVDLFFVISGFIMTWTTWNKFRQNYASLFLRKRLARVLPPYWLATSLGVAIIAFFPSLLSSGQTLDWAWIVASYLFQPWRGPEGDVFSPVIGLGWTLNFEIYFYFLFSLSLCFTRRIGLIALLGFLFISVVTLSIFPPHIPLLIQMGSWLTLEFALGVVVAMLVKHDITVSPRLRFSMVLGASVLLFSSVLVEPKKIEWGGLHFAKFISHGLSCAVLLWVTIQYDWNRNLNPTKQALFKFFAKLGDASYSLYLFQIFFLPTIGLVMKKLKLSQVLPFDLSVLLLASACTGLGWVAFIFIEKPITLFAAKLFRIDSINVAKNGDRPTGVSRLVSVE